MNTTKMYKAWVAYFEDTEDLTIASFDTLDFLSESGPLFPSLAVLRCLADTPATGLLMPYYNPVSKEMKVAIIHHLFSTRIESKQKYHGFLGFKDTQVPPLIEIPDKTLSRFTDKKSLVLTPSKKDLLKTVTSAAEIRALQISNEEREAFEKGTLIARPADEIPFLYEGRRVSALPPFLIATLTDTEDTVSAFIVAQEVINKVLDSIDEEDEIGFNETLDALIPLLQLLWITTIDAKKIAKHEHFTPILSTSLVETEDEATIAWGRTIAHRFCQSLNDYVGDEDDNADDSGNNNNAVAGNINNNNNDADRREHQRMRASVDRQTDVMSRILTALITTIEKNTTHTPVTPANPRKTSAKWSDGLNPWSVKMITRAAADVTVAKGIPIVPAEAPTTLFQDFLKETGAKNSCNTLTHHINGLQCINTTVDRNLSNTLHTLILVPPIGSEKPGRYTLFYMGRSSSTNPMGASLSDLEFNMRRDANMLHEEHIQAVSKSKITIPKSVLDFAQYLKNYRNIWNYMITETSALSIAITRWIAEVETEQAHYENMFSANPEFIVQLMLAITERVNTYLDSCTRAEEFSDVDMSVLDFTRDFADIRSRRFHLSLPPFYKKLTTSQNGSSDKETTSGKGTSDESNKSKSGNKRASDKESQKDKAGAKKSKGTTRNSKAVAAWKTTEGNFAHFAKEAKTIPKHQGTSICLKWHLIGKCSYGDGCERASTHTQFDSDGATYEKMDSWYNGLKATLGKEEGSQG